VAFCLKVGSSVGFGFVTMTDHEKKHHCATQKE